MSPVTILVRQFCSKAAKMVRVLNVAEKNDAAKSLADIMSRGQYRKREGFSRFNKIYEYEYHILNQNCTMTMTSLSGHLLNFDFTGPYRQWRGCNPVQLFEAPVEKQCSQDYINIKRTLEREIRQCNTLIIWTDCDREGENIGFEIIQVCKAVKQNIRVYRARFSEITPQAVNRAVQNLQEPDKNTSDAVDVRQELDLRIGAAFTRFQTLRLQRIFPDVLAEQLISYGSCQFPTLGFVVERYKQLQAFIPEPFWKIKVTHEVEEAVVEFSWKRIRLFNHLACLVLYQHCLEKPEAKVTDVRSRPKSRWRPVALDTVELEKLASRKLKINAKETMKIAEKLYTQGFISYPRTETNMFPKELDLAGMIQQQSVDQAWGAFAQGLLNDGPNPRNGHKTDQAHPPIHPTKYTNNLQGNEKRVYEFVVRHFLACCSKDAQGQETTVEIDIHQESFSTQGLMIIARNYLDVYPYDKWSAKVIPTFNTGEVFQPKCIEMNQGETSPPSLLTEADLITLMDKHGIGTDATHAEHIETIKSRKYVGLQQDQRFVPGELGMGLVEGYDAMGFEMSKPNLRAELEADLKLICQGRKNSDDVLAEQIQKYKHVFEEAVIQANKIDLALTEYFGQGQAVATEELEVPILVSIKPCANCGKDMHLKTKKDGNGYFISCSGYPGCRNAIWLPDNVLGVTVSDEVCHTCRPGPVKKLKFKFKKGSVPPYIPLQYTGCIGGCDETLRELFNVSGPHSSSNHTARPGNNHAARPGNNHAASARPGGGTRSQSSGDSGYSSGSNLSRPTNNAARPPLSTVNGPGLVPTAARRDVATPANRGGRVDGGADDANAVVCRCGEDARLLTVRKEGPNTGRQFYACAKPQDSKCDFFLWADQRPEGGGDGRGGGGGGGGRGGGGGGGWGGGGGGNQGRYSKPSNQGGAANRGGGFGGSYGATGPGPHQQNSYGSGDSENFAGGGGDAVSCKCGQEAKLLTVQKEGPNTGRQFHTCPKGRDQGCNFFQWADEPGGGGGGGDGAGFGRDFPPRARGRGGGGGGRGGSSRRGAGGATGGPKKKRHCGKCGGEGHNKRNCPNS